MNGSPRLLKDFNEGDIEPGLHQVWTGVKYHDISSEFWGSFWRITPHISGFPLIFRVGAGIFG